MLKRGFFCMLGFPQLPHSRNRQRLDRIDFEATMIDDEELLTDWKGKLNNKEVESRKGRRVLNMYDQDCLRKILSFTVNKMENGRLCKKTLVLIVLVTPTLAFCRVCHVRLNLTEPLKLDGIWQHLDTVTHGDVSI